MRSQVEPGNEERGQRIQLLTMICLYRDIWLCAIAQKEKSFSWQYCTTNGLSLKKQRYLKVELRIFGIIPRPLLLTGSKAEPENA